MRELRYYEPTYRFNPKFQANANANELNELKAQLSEAQKLAAQYRTDLEAAQACCRKMELDLERVKLTSSVKTMSPSAAEQTFMAKLEERDREILKLRQEVAQITDKINMVIDTKDAQIKRLHALGGTDTTQSASADDKKARNLAISAETESGVAVPQIPKSDAEKETIRVAIAANTFMRSLNKAQNAKITDAMSKKVIPAKQEIISEGTAGDCMYIIEAGEVQVFKGTGAQRNHVCDLGPRTLFGELAILYNCKRTATIISKTSVTVWVIERAIFQAVVKQAGREDEEERFRFISSVKDLSDLPEAKLRRICDCLDEETYENGSCIIRQGAKGDLFFMIKSGSVRITINEGKAEKEVATKAVGDYFGERALIQEDVRSANVYAVGKTSCFTLDRNAFNSLVGKLGDAKVADKNVAEASDEPTRKVHDALKNCTFDDMEMLRPIGAGGFGIVKLVKIKGIEDRSYALKCIQKQRVVQYKQQRHILDEKNILMSLESPFIVGLYRTFKDQKYVYLLLDAYLGGDLWGVLHNQGPFNDAIARFYVACVVEGFGYLHKRGYCYRDLKPENLMVDNNGYVRIIDLGFAKKIQAGQKTYTFCGTPEYIPPEIVSNSGHTIAADYWSLGILVFELLSKKTPFAARADLEIYEGIMRGIHNVAFPQHRVTRKAESMIKALCRQEPSERLGYQKGGVDDIRKHRWFQGFDWEGLQQEKIEAPFIPAIKNPFDVQNFEPIPDEDVNRVPVDNSGWDKDF